VISLSSWICPYVFISYFLSFFFVETMTPNIDYPRVMAEQMGMSNVLDKTPCPEQEEPTHVIMGKKEKRSKGKNDCNVNSASSPSKKGRFSINDVEPSPDMIVLIEGVTEDVRSSPDRVALTKDDDTSALVHTPSPMPPRVDAQLLLLHFGVSCSRTIDDTAFEIRIKEFEDKDRADEEEMRRLNESQTKVISRSRKSSVVKRIC
jgi:hypothetical protein